MADRLTVLGLEHSARKHPWRNDVFKRKLKTFLVRLAFNGEC